MQVALHFTYNPQKKFFIYFCELTLVFSDIVHYILHLNDFNNNIGNTGLLNAGQTGSEDPLKKTIASHFYISKAKSTKTNVI